MKKNIILWLLAFLIICPQLAHAQSQRNPCFYNVTPGPTDGCTPVSKSFPLPVSASVTASIAPFTPSGSFATLTVTGTTSTVTLPTQTGTVLIQNTGTTTVSCTLGSTAAANQIQIPANSTVPVGTGSATALACIDQTGSTSNLIVIAGGTGLGTAFGGGSSSGGGGGGAVFGPTAVGTAAANPPVLIGGTVDGTGTGAVSVLKVVSGIGYVNNAQVNGVTVLTGAGATGTGAQRVGVAQDTSTIAGSAPGTAGTPSTNVVSVQGVTAGTNIPVSQATAANLNATVVPSTLAAWGLVASTQNSTTPTNAQLADCQFNTSPTTVTSGNVTPIQCNNAGAINVAIVSGGGSGGTASSFSSAFPTTGTAMGLTNGTNMVPWSATTNYGTAPSAIPVPAVNAFITNTNANGSTTSANSSPVVIASDQAAVATKVASGGIASGALASGSISSGAAVSGAFVAGSIADLAHGSATSANSVPVVLATDQAAADPCMFKKKTNLPISQNGTSSVQLIALSGSTTIYVCSISLIAAGATTVALTTGTGTACVTGNAAVIGTTTASIANSISLAANGGLTLGNGGGTVASGAASSELCMVLGTSVFVAGNLTYVQQ